MGMGDFLPLIPQTLPLHNMNISPYLTIVTRTCKRPKALKACITSLKKQTKQDYEHLIIRDRIGRGVPWANGMLARRDWSDINGLFVYILDDDNFMYHGAVEKIIETAPGHDLTFYKIYRPRHGQRTFPEQEYWRERPVPHHIDVGNVVMRRDLFKDAVLAFTERYEGDYDFIITAFDNAKSINWVDYKIMRMQEVSRGAFEE